VFSCPRCKVRLKRHKQDSLIFWRCDQCDGRTASLGLLRQVASRETIDNLWRTAAKGGRSGVACPSCERPMAEVAVPTGAGTELLDVCRSCHFIWFDATEFESLPPKPPEPPPILEEKPVTAAGRRETAVLKAKLATETARVEAGAQPAPEHAWQWLPGLLGLPVQDNPSALARMPLVNLSLLLLILSFSIPALFDLEDAVQLFGLIPDRPGRHYGLTLVTSFLVHGSVLHLIGNAYFLLAFGNSTEDFLGHLRFGLLVLVATVIGHMAHMLIHPDGTVPCVGASGGISGVITFYAFRFSRAKLWLFVRVAWIRLPAAVLFFAWIALQLFYLVEQLTGRGHISAAAHLGGVGVGFAWWLLFRKRA
jgi:membrane associated rhomboid family serine protease